MGKGRGDIIAAANNLQEALGALGDLAMAKIDGTLQRLWASAKQWLAEVFLTADHGLNDAGGKFQQAAVAAAELYNKLKKPGAEVLVPRLEDPDRGS